MLIGFNVLEDNYNFLNNLIEYSTVFWHLV